MRHRASATRSSPRIWSTASRTTTALTRPASTPPATPTAEDSSTLLPAALTTAASLRLLPPCRAPCTPTSTATTTAILPAPRCPCSRLTELPIRQFRTTLRDRDVVARCLRFLTGYRGGRDETSAPLPQRLIWPLGFMIRGGSVRALTACCAMSRLMEPAMRGLALARRLTFLLR